MSISLPPLPGTAPDPLYPDTDGEPLGETGIHVEVMIDVYKILRRYYRGREDVYVACDMFLYYEQGNPSACRAPDVMVSLGVMGNHHRRSFRLWEEKVAPAVVFEVTSEKTRRNDQVDKPSIYARIGVSEYFIFDPFEEYLEPRLQGFRMGARGFQPIKPDAEGRLTSQKLQMAVEADELSLGFIDLKTGKPIASVDELADKAEHAKREAQRDRRRLKRAEQLAEAERKRAEAERKRAEELEKEVARLRAQQKRRNK